MWHKFQKQQKINTKLSRLLQINLETNDKSFKIVCH